MDPWLDTCANDAATFLRSHAWCDQIRACEVMLAVPGFLAVARCDIRSSRPGVDPWVWVVVGDLPPAYLANDNPTCADALEGYVYELRRWCRAVCRHESTTGIIPVPGKPTPEYAELIEERLGFIGTHIIPTAEESPREQLTHIRIAGLPIPLHLACPENWYAIREGIQQLEWIRLRDEHYEQYLGASAWVFHSDDESADRPHIDVNQIEPIPRRPYWTYATSGMSNWPQYLPKRAPPTAAPRVELIAYTQQRCSEAASTLWLLGRYPFEHRTFFYHGHTIPSGAEGEDKPAAWLLMPPLLEDQELGTLRIDGDPVQFLWVLPISKGELDYSRRKGGTRLGRMLWARQVTRFLDVPREPLF